MKTQLANQKAMIIECEGNKKLSSWDEDFLESINDRLELDRPLTDRQAEVLERIWEKCNA